MLRNYLKTTFRSLKKNLTYTSINVIGLAIGLSGVLITFALIEYEYTFDGQFENIDQIYRINSLRKIEGQSQNWGITPIPLGPEFSEQTAGVESFTRYGTARIIVRNGDKVHSENMYFADYNFFDHFHFSLAKGNISSFKEKNTALITSEFSKKYFGEENSLGKQIEVLLNDRTVQSFIVGGILKKIPQNSSFRFDVIVPYENIFDIYNIPESAWTVEIPTITYIRLDQLTDAQVISKNLRSFTDKNNELLETWKVKEFYLMPYRDQGAESRTLYSAITWSGLPLSALYGSMFMNGVILLIACFNFANTAIAYAQKRLKEIGLRKTFGSLKNQILMQFLLENFIQCILAMIIAVEIAQRWILWMNIQWPIDLSFNYFRNPLLLIILILTLVIVTLLAGAYPAFYLSKFQPSYILKGDIKFAGTNPLNRILLTWQFGLSITAIFAGIALWLNAKYQSELDFGYNKENVVVINLYDNDNFETYKNSVLGIAGVQNMAGAIHNVGFGYETIDIDIDGMLHQTERLLVGDNYLNTMELNLTQGRDFIINSENDINESIIVNEKFIETFNISNPLSQAIKMDSQSYFIVGVIQDFMPYGLHRPINPVILKKIPDDQCQLLCVNTDITELVTINNELSSTWKDIFPNKPYEGYYQQEALNEAEHINKGILKQFGVLSFFALFLSTSGLFSLVSLSINRRTKEIGIRKIMGASITQIIYLLNREFLGILAIGSILGSVMGYYFMQAFLGDIFDHHIDMGPAVFFISISIIVCTAILTSGRKIYHAASINPAESLKYE